MAVNKISFQKVMDASIEDLANLVHESGNPLNEAISIEVFYAQTLLYFLRADIAGLKSQIQKAETLFSGDDEFAALLLCCNLRLRIRERAFAPDLLKQAEDLAHMNSRWQGELALLLGSAFFVYENFALSSEWYAKATFLLQHQGCVKRALRTRMNVLICESHLNPQRNLIAEYHDLYRQAMKRSHQDLIVSTTCLLNISREFQATGALHAALKYCARGLQLAEFHFGSYSHHLLLVHRAHLYCQLGRLAEAKVDFEMAQTSAFSEVQAALGVVRPLLVEGVTVQENLASLIPTWRERAEEIKSGAMAPSLSDLEQKLLHFLARGARSRVDILEHLYGERLSYETKLNRFKSLLVILRRKLPHLVLYRDGQYLLADKILVPMLSKPSSRRRQTS